MKEKYKEMKHKYQYMKEKYKEMKETHKISFYVIGYENCGYYQRAIELLNNLNKYSIITHPVPFHSIRNQKSILINDTKITIPSTHDTSPYVVYVDSNNDIKHIGGCNDLKKAIEEKKYPF